MINFCTRGSCRRKKPRLDVTFKVASSFATLSCGIVWSDSVAFSCQVVAVWYCVMGFSSHPSVCSGCVHKRKFAENISRNRPSTGSNALIWFSLLRNLYLGLISAEVGKVRHALKGDGEWDSAAKIGGR